MASSLAAAAAPRPQLPCGRPSLRAQAAPSDSAGAASMQQQQLAVRLSAAEGPAVLEGVSTLVLDCDGVLWRGSELMPGTVQALQRFREMGKRLLFLTNNSSKSRRAYKAKFDSLGIAVTPEEIVCTSYTAAAYLASVGFAGTAFLISNPEGTAQELEAAGIPYLTFEQICAGGSSSGSSGANGGVAASSSTAAAFRDSWTPETLGALQLDAGIGAVVVGWDPHFDYHKLCYASACLRELPGCLFVATNLDSADRMGCGRFMPGTGCSVQAVETASGRQAVNVGKGGDWLLPYLCSKYDLQPSEACIVGDRLDTDIALGRSGGLRTVLPLTGVTTEAQLAAAAEGELPHYVTPNLAALAGIEA